MKNIARSLLTEPPFALVRQELLFGPVLFVLHLPGGFQLLRLTVAIPSAIAKPSHKGAGMHPVWESQFSADIQHSCYSLFSLPLK